MRKLFPILAILLASGCTIGQGIVDRAVDGCETVVEDNLDVVTDLCEEVVDDAIDQCIAEINNAIDAFEVAIEQRVEAFLISNGCINVGTDRWNCSASDFCGW